MLIYASKLRFLMKYILVFHPVRVPPQSVPNRLVDYFCLVMTKNIYREKLSSSLKSFIGERDLANFGRAMKMNSPRDYSRVFRQAKRVSGSGLTILTVENSMRHPRLGLAIAKKHLKLANRRNRLKRIIRESFRLHQSDFANIDIVVLTRPDIVKRDPTEIWQTLERHWLTVVAQWQKKS